MTAPTAEYKDMWNWAQQAAKYGNALTLASIYDQMGKIMAGQDFDTFTEFMAYAPAVIPGTGNVPECRRDDMWRAWLPKADLTTMNCKRVTRLVSQLTPGIAALVVLTWAAQVHLDDYPAAELVALAKSLTADVREKMQLIYDRQCGMFLE